MESLAHLISETKPAANKDEPFLSQFEVQNVMKMLRYFFINELCFFQKFLMYLMASMFQW